ncbi:LysM peptidoglycan-binding domain-containing protein [Nocardioides okcheonensis]|uniref:LysM peptidoglycan-binding domain-containing protein n=1 Tax=Nocardioides okcheonensis TaxID=2894081 RepID=UPI001E582BF9|nr:LysM domain-containing protein [Nocardioides okcheonensis]UFN44103.1 LysM peptidoglycan-binding domain-containing protein [Nocardioides okcheonensis]
MSRGTTRIRAATVWLAVSAGTAGTAQVAHGLVREALTAGSAGPSGVTSTLVAGCAVVLALALLRTWLVTTVTVAGVVTGSTGGVERHAGPTRRLVLLACGVAVAAGAAAPAAAPAGRRGRRGDGRHVVAGLALPERAVATTTGPTSAPTSAEGTAPAGDYVVRPGDSLWSIAVAHPAGDGTGTDERWRAIWRANRAVVGDDPDLIHPGQALRLTPTTHQAPQDGDRR